MGTADFAPITKKLGLRLVSFEDGRAVVEMDVDETFHNSMGMVHGGVFCDLADAAIGCAMATTLADDDGFTTIDLQASYFRGVRSGHLTAQAKVVRRGRTTAYLECEIYESEKLTAKVISTCMILSKP